MKKFKNLFFIELAAAILFFSATSAAQWRENGEAAQDSAWMKHSGELGAMLMFTDDPEGLFEAWDRPPSPDYAPQIQEVSVAHRGDVVLAFVIFADCAADEEGLCDTTVEYSTYYPDGRQYGHHIGELWSGKTPPDEGHLQLSVENLGIRFEEDDPFGSYNFKVVIVDRVDGTTLSLEKEISLVEPE